MRALWRWSGILGLAALAVVASCGGGDDGDPVEPDPSGSIRATVTADGAARAGVTVRVFADGGSAALETGTTASNGQVTFGDLDPGAYDVEIVVPAGFELAGGAARRDVTVSDGQVATVTYALAEIVVPPTEGQIRARVVDGSVGVEGVEVNLYEAGGTAILETLATDADGRALFQALSAGDYDVEIELPEGFVVAAGDTVKKAVGVTVGTTTDVEFGVVGPEEEVVEVSVLGTSFSPDELTISAGTTVRWVWSGGTHTVTPDGHSEWAAAPINTSSRTFEHTFDSAGTFEYFCEFHVSAGMTGVITVQ